MLGSIKLIVSLALFAAGAASIFVGYKKWAWVMRRIFGKERVEKQGTSAVAIYLYILGGVLILLGLLILF